MKSPLRRRTVCVLAFALGISLLAGCHSDTASDSPGGDLNSSMSADQKAVIAAHKQQQEQEPVPPAQASGQ